MILEFVSPKAKLIERAHPGKIMEYAGMLCHKSNHNVDDSSYIPFLKTILLQGHLSILEHGVVYTIVQTEDICSLVKMKAAGIFHGINFMNFVKMKDAEEQWILAFNLRSGVELIS